MFDPLNDLPETDEQVKECLSYGRSQGIAETLIGIYEVCLAQGDNLLEAYAAALRAHAAAIESHIERWRHE